MFGEMWIGDDFIGEVAAITTSRTKRGCLKDDAPDCVDCVDVGIAGTLVFSNLDWQLYEKHFPRHVEDPFKVDEVLVKLNPVMPHGPSDVHLMGFTIWSEGWGWTVDDLTGEYAVTWTADVLDYSFDYEGRDVVKVIR